MELKRENKEKNPWKLYNGGKLCSKYFIDGEPSNLVTKTKLPELEGRS